MIRIRIPRGEEETTQDGGTVEEKEGRPHNSLRTVFL